MAYIFSFSAAPAEVSKQDSSKVTEKVVRLIERDYDKLQEKEQKSIFSKVEGVVRKIAHFSLYAVLGILVCLACFFYEKSSRMKYVSGFCVCLVYAISDEIHQFFSPGRAPLVKDVFIDSAGSAVGMIISLLVIWGVIRIIKNCTENKE